MRPALILVDAPGFDLGLRILDRRELVDVQALAQAAVERLDDAFSTGLPGRMRSSCTRLTGPVLEGARHALGAGIDQNRPQPVRCLQHLIERSADSPA